jgi:hypothetical protein
MTFRQGMAALVRKSKHVLREEGLITYVDRARRALTVRARRIFMDKQPVLARWRAIKGLYEGQRTFLIGNGPSLNRTPLHLLAGEHTMCFNRFNLMFDRLCWRPSFFVTIDDRVLEDMASEIDEVTSQVGMAFFPDLHPFNIDFRPLIAQRDNVYWLWLDRLSFSDDLPYAGINKSVANVGLQVLAHLGFQEIYLLGVDMDYQDHQSAAKNNARDWTATKDDDPNHFDPRYFGTGRRYHHPRMDETRVKFEEGRSFFDQRGVCIRNAGVGGQLEVFPRVEFRQLIAMSPQREMELLLAPVGRRPQGTTLRESIPEAVALSSSEDWTSSVRYAILPLGEAVRVIPKAVFTHIPLGPFGDEYLFVPRRDD